jgi:hypothetical protein
VRATCATGLTEELRTFVSRGAIDENRRLRRCNSFESEYQLSGTLTGCVLNHLSVYQTKHIQRNRPHIRYSIMEPAEQAFAMHRRLPALP